MLAAYQARVDHEIGDPITRQPHRVLMKYGKRALTREDGSYHLGVSVGALKDESTFVYEKEEQGSILLRKRDRRDRREQCRGNEPLRESRTAKQVR